MIRTNLFVARLISTSFGPFGTTPCIFGEAGSSTQSKSSASTYTLCTQTKCVEAGPGEFQISFGYGTGFPSTISATEMPCSSDQAGKLTKTRPLFETATPVICCSGKLATSCNWTAKAECAARSRIGRTSDGLIFTIFES